MIDAAPSTSRGSNGRSIAPFVTIVLTLCVVTGVALLIQPARTGAPRRTAPPIALLGDSITDQARTELTEALAPSAVDIRAIPGKKVHEMLGAASDVAQEKPDRVVINLGSNDVLLDERPDVTLAALHDLAGRFAGKACVHLVTVNESFFLLFPEGQELQRRARLINDEIRKIARESGFAVIDWAKVIAEASSASPPVLLTADTVHPNAAGKQKLASAYVDSVARGCPAPVR